MFTILSNENLARLHTKLVIPFAISDLMKDQKDITPDIQYALHEALSEMDPDTALIAIALSCDHIASYFCPDIPVSCALKVEAEKIVNEYGSDWLAHADGRAPQREGERLFELLEHIPEDLEALADILDSIISSLDDDNQVSKDLAYILSVQARAHMEIADYILEELQGHDIQNAPHVHKHEEYAGNIVLFPGTVH